MAQRIALISFFMVLLNSCIGKTITFSTDGPAMVSLVSWDNINETGEKVGETPATIDFSKINGRIIKITQPGKVPQFWVIPKQLQGDILKANVTLADVAAADGHSAKIEIAQLNRANRMLIKSMQALNQNDFVTANELAEQMGKMSETAAPHLIVGLSQLARGNKAAARIAFLKATALDPEDQDLKALLQSTE